MSSLEIKTLFLVRELPFPPMGGVPLRNWQNISILAQWGTVGIFSIFRQGATPDKLPGVSLWRHCSNQVDRGPLARKVARRLYPLKPEYPYADGLYNRQAYAQLRQCLRDFQPQLIIVEELWFYPYLRLLQQTGRPIILDSHNLETVLVKDLFKVEVRSPTWGQRRLQGWRSYHLQRIEQRMVQGVSQNWVCSLEDKQGLERLYTPAPSWVVPNGIDMEYYQGVSAGQISPPPDLQVPQPTVLFLGTLAYGPNIEAVEWLVTEIYPLLRQSHPHCRLLLVGRNPKPRIKAVARDNPNIWLTGAVADVRPYMAAAQMLVVPLKRGGGTRLKILEAFAAGCPVISTTKGAEGLQGRDGTHLLIRDTTAAIAAAITQLWEKPVLGSTLAAAAWQLADQIYSRKAIAHPIQASLQSLGFAVD